MTPEEYVHLKAFARQDGALLSLVWIGALVCYIQGLSNPLLGLVALILIVTSPLYAANRLRHFRDEARQGIISFRRGYAYTVMTFFYAGLLLALVLYLYFAFIDKGYVLGVYTQMVNSEESQQFLRASGLAEQMKEGLQALGSMRPIDYALNMLTINIASGFLLGLPIAALMQRQTVRKS